MNKGKQWMEEMASSSEEARTSHSMSGRADSDRPIVRWGEIRTKFVHVTRALRIAWKAASTWTVSWALLLLLKGTLPVVTVYLTKVVVDAVTGAIGGGLSWENLEPVVYPAGAMGGVLFANQFLQNAITWVRTCQSEYVTDYIKELIHQKTAAVDLEFYDIPEYFDHMSRANEEADRRVLSILENTGGVVQSTVTLAGISGILLTYGWWVPLVLIGSTLPALLVVIMHQSIYHTWWRDTTEQRRWARYYDMVITKRECAQEVRLFDLGEEFRRSYQQIREALRNSHIRLLRNQRLASFGAGVLAICATGAIMAWMVLRAFQGASTLGDIALFYQAFNQGQGLMRTLLRNVGTLYADALFLEHLFAFLEIEPRVKAPADPAPVPKTVRQGIEVRDVTFRYPGSDQVALKDFSLSIPGGKTVAVVGKNGVGKSTLIKLLCRFYDPEEGHVLWDGIDIQRFDPNALWRRVTVHFQHPVNYAGTLAESIAYGDRTVKPTPERVQEAAVAAGADTVAQNVELGYQNMLGKQFDGGADLSGGEWQRVALARAFYRKAPFILLDEPTSFMDSWAEMQWLDRFFQLAEDRTAVLVTHRFTTAMRADLIYVMDGGCVVESGTHRELLETEGLYAASWRKQVQSEHVLHPSG